MAKITLNKVIAVLLLMCLSMGIYLGIVAICFYRKKEIGLGFMTQADFSIAYERLMGEYDRQVCSETKEFYKSFVEDDIGLRFYIYAEKSLKKGSGFTFPTIRTIVVDKSLTGYQYCLTFTHEVMHLKHFIKQETYVCYETFKYLYESEELHNVGVWYGLKQLSGDYSGEYNVCGHIVNYLTNK